MHDEFSILCLLVCQILLHHTTNLAVGVEVLTDAALLVEWATNLLCCSPYGTIDW